MVYPELKKVLIFRVANFPDYRRLALQTFQIAIGLLSYFQTFRVALLPRWQKTVVELDLDFNLGFVFPSKFPWVSLPIKGGNIFENQSF